MINKFDLQACRLLIRVVPIACCLAGPAAMVSRHQPLFVELDAASRGLVEVRFSACQVE